MHKKIFKLNKEYNEEYCKRLIERSKTPRHKEEIIRTIEWVRPFKKEKILEVGCGTGRALRYLKNHSFANGYGIDIFDMVLKECADLNVRNGDAMKIPFPNNFFSKVYSIHSIGHIKNPLKFFKEAYRVLKSRGKLVIITPNKEFIKAIKPLNKSGKIPYEQDKTRLHVLNLKQLIALFVKFNFRIIDFEFFGRIPKKVKTKEYPYIIIMGQKIE